MRQKGVWFSRHDPTQEQSEKIDFLAVEEGKALGSIVLENQEQVEDVVEKLRDICIRERTFSIYGVFPVPVMGMFKHPGEALIQCFGAWNITRAEEGQKPTFHHKRWVCIGVL